MASDSDLGDDDFRLVAWAHRHVLVGPDRDDVFRQFLAIRLHDHYPALSARLAAASDAVLDALHARLRRHQRGDAGVG